MDLRDKAIQARARAVIEHRRAGVLLSREESANLITNIGRDFIHDQAYGVGAQQSGLNYIALSDDPVTETVTSTTLSNEITTHGLGRARGDVNHDDNTNITTISHTFTCSGAPQAAQKTALFAAPDGNTPMNHVIGFSERSLLPSDTLTVTFTITLG